MHCCQGAVFALAYFSYPELNRLAVVKLLPELTSFKHLVAQGFKEGKTNTKQFVRAIKCRKYKVSLMVCIGILGQV